MEDRLFKGQIKAAAQPIGSFIQPAQFNTPGAARRPMLGEVARISTIQQAGTSSVKGFNQAQQIADALGPLNKNLSTLYQNSVVQYAKDSLEAGYNEELKNAAVRSQLVLQEQQEMGAGQAAAQQSQLAKVDPIGAALLREANPWKKIGRRRALAQLAASEVSTVLNADLAMNSGELAGIAPGSETLLNRKAALSQQVLNKYGLTGEEPEAMKYVTPVMNKGWDKYTQKQSELFTAEVYSSTVTATGAAVTAQAQQMANDGITLQTGEVLKPGDPRFAAAAGFMLTRQIDTGLALLGGEDKVNAMKTINQNLGMLRSLNVPGISAAIDNIRVGSNKVPMEQRPRWIDANPYELMDFTNKSLKLQNENYEEDQKRLERSFDQEWNGPDGPGALPYGSDEWKTRSQALVDKYRGLGYRNPEEYADTRAKDEQSFEEGAYAADEQTIANWQETLVNLTPAQLEDGGVAMRLMAKEMAAAEPTPELRAAKLKEYNDRITQAQKQFAGLPKNSDMRSQVGRLVREDLNDPEISKLKGKMAFMTGPLGQIDLLRVGGGETTATEARYEKFANEVRDLYTQAGFQEFQDWRNANNGAEVPVDMQAALLKVAAEKVRASEPYKQLKNEALGLDSNGQAPPPRKPQNLDPSQGPVPAAAAGSIQPKQAKSYRDTAVMAPSWVHSELKTVQTTGKTSANLDRLAQSAQVMPQRYLLEQLKFYPQLDPTGGARAFLEGFLDGKKATSTPATTYGDQSSTPRSPGAWLNGLVMPVEITRLPGGVQGPSQGPYTPVKRYPSGWMPEGGEPGAPRPMPTPIA